jgi:hypothetical protein
VENHAGRTRNISPSLREFDALLDRDKTLTAK